MQASIILLTTESSASTVNVPSMVTVKIEPSDDDILVLLDADEDVYHVVDLLDHHLFFIRLSPPIRFWTLWMFIKPLTICRTGNWFVIVFCLNVQLFILLHLLHVLILLMH